MLEHGRRVAGTFQHVDQTVGNVVQLLLLSLGQMCSAMSRNECVVCSPCQDHDSQATRH